MNAPLPLSRPPARRYTSLVDLCLYSPWQLYAYNHAVLLQLSDEFPCISRRLITMLLTCNYKMSRCAALPPYMAVFVFFWLASLHEGVRRMVLDTEQDRDRRAHLEEALFHYADLHITSITNRNITSKSASRRAYEFYLVLYMLVHNRMLDLTLTLLPAKNGKIPKHVKERMITARKARKKLAAEVAAAAEDDSSGSDGGYEGGSDEEE
jgi:hypothetical protein